MAQHGLSDIRDEGVQDDSYTECTRVAWLQFGSLRHQVGANVASFAPRRSGGDGSRRQCVSLFSLSPFSLSVVLERVRDSAAARFILKAWGREGDLSALDFTIREEKLVVPQKNDNLMSGYSIGTTVATVEGRFKKEQKLFSGLLEPTQIEVREAVQDFDG